MFPSPLMSRTRLQGLHYYQGWDIALGKASMRQRSFMMEFANTNASGFSLVDCSRDILLLVLSFLLSLSYLSIHAST